MPKCRQKVKLKRVNQPPKILFGEIYKFCDGSLHHDRCSVLSNRDSLKSWLGYLSAVSAGGSCVIQGNLFEWMLLENISHVFQGGLPNTVSCSFIVSASHPGTPKPYLYRGFDYVRVWFLHVFDLRWRQWKPFVFSKQRCLQGIFQWHESEIDGPTGILSGV